jgi:hypothetical protein
MAATVPHANRSVATQKKSSRKDALKQMATLIEKSMEHLSEEEKDRRVRNFSKRVDKATLVRARS